MYRSKMETPLQYSRLWSSQLARFREIQPHLCNLLGIWRRGTEKGQTEVLEWRQLLEGEKWPQGAGG